MDFLSKYMGIVLFFITFVGVGYATAEAEDTFHNNEDSINSNYQFSHFHQEKKSRRGRNPYVGCERDPEKTTNDNYPFKSRYVEIDGYRIHYTEVGKGRPILFVHGNPTWSYIWRNIFPCVARNTNRRAIAVDLLGFGKSDKPALDYSAQLHADILRKFIEKLELDNLVVVGQDWGGPLLTHFATRFPEKIEGIALFETFIWKMELFGDFAQLITFTRSPQGQYVLFNDKDWFVENFIERAIINQDNFSNKTYRNYVVPLSNPDHRHAMAKFPVLLPFTDDPNTPQDALDFFTDIEDSLFNLQDKELLVMKATPGLVISEASMASVDNFVSLFPKAEVRSVGQGLHDLQEDNPDLITYRISQWLWEKGLTGNQQWWDRM